jgi:hypothetical protein
LDLSLESVPTGVTGHSGRRTHATLAMNSGKVDGATLAKSTHHANPQTLQRYIDADRSTLQRPSSVIAELVSGVPREQKSSTVEARCTIEISEDEEEPFATSVKQELPESPKKRSKKLAMETPPKKVRRASSLSRAVDARINGTPPWKLFSQTAADMDAIEEAMLLGVEMAFRASRKLVESKEERIRREIEKVFEGLTEKDFEFDDRVLKPPETRRVTKSGDRTWLDLVAVRGGTKWWLSNASN